MISTRQWPLGKGRSAAALPSTRCLLALFLGGGLFLFVLEVFPRLDGFFPPRSFAAGADAPFSTARQKARFTALDEAHAWDRLPAAMVGKGKPLPQWARTLARGLPRTTAAMLELDYLQRERSPLPPLLRGQLRWTAAHANHCAYSEAYALADLRRAGMDEAAVKALTQDKVVLTAKERTALEFARKLTLTASAVSDAEVSQLIDDYGEKPVVAMVLLLAYANFQDRLFLALDLTVEEDGPLPPLKVCFSRQPPTERSEAWSRPLEGQWGEKQPPTQAAYPNWQGMDYSQLQLGLEKQRSRRSRLTLPEGRAGQIHWGAVCRTHQPELAAAWTACTHAFDVETDQDPVFQQSLFWVVTRSEKCLY